MCVCVRAPGLHTGGVTGKSDPLALVQTPTALTIVSGIGQSVSGNAGEDLQAPSALLVSPLSPYNG